MHRPSSVGDPFAPLSHHWTDSTHIAFNVVTLGAGWRWVAVDGSVFRGREPDENRWDIEGGGIDWGLFVIDVSAVWAHQSAAGAPKEGGRRASRATTPWAAAGAGTARSCT